LEKKTARQNLKQKLKGTQRKTKSTAVTLLKKEIINTPSTQKIHTKFGKY